MKTPTIKKSTKIAAPKKMMNGGKTPMTKKGVKKAQNGLNTDTTTTNGRGPNKGNFNRTQIGIATDKMPVNNKWGYKFVPSDEERQYWKDQGVSNTPPTKRVTNSKSIKDGQFNKKEKKDSTEKGPSEIINKSLATKAKPKKKMMNGGYSKNKTK